MIKLYSTNCPKCIMLESMLKRKNINYELINGYNVDELIEEMGYSSAPILKVDNKYMEFDEAKAWVNKR